MKPKFVNVFNKQGLTLLPICYLEDKKAKGPRGKNL